MAFNDNTSLYTGKDVMGFYSKALLMGDSKSLFKLYPDVKTQIKIARYDMSNILGEESCDFTDSGSSTLSQKVLAVKNYQVNMQFCKKDFNSSYLSEQIKSGANNENFPASLEEYILSEIAKHIQTSTEYILWKGDTVAGDQQDGLIKLFNADANVNDATIVAIDSSNVVAQFKKVYEAIPDTIFGSADLKFMVNTKTAKFYMEALAQASAEQYFVGDKSKNFLGIEIVVIKDIPDNVIIASELSNIWIAVDAEGDFTDVNLRDLELTTGDKKFRFMNAFKFGWGYGVSEEITYGHI